MPNHYALRDPAARGFTLVEMSIVLVIIGLIIGGILKGQEIIAGARQKAVISQANAVKSATSTYFDRYRALPGDDPTSVARLDANVANGNGNGVVGAVPAAATAASILGTARNAGENYQFFNALVAAGLINGAEVTAAITADVYGKGSALPASPISGAGLTVSYGTHQGAGAASIKAMHWAILHKDPTAAAAGTGVAVSPRTLANIDTQTDDGVANTGGVRGDMRAACHDVVTGAYLATDDTTCVAFFEVTQ